MQDLDKILNLKYNNVIPEPGKVLLSGPFMEDYHFSHSVVLIVDNNDEGSVGVVLNKVYNPNICDIVFDFPRINMPVFLGGPVQKDSLVFIHSLGKRVPGSLKITDDLWFGGDFDIVREMARNHIINRSNIRFFAGYSGWVHGQLDDELKRHDWLVSDINPADCFLYFDEMKLWNFMLDKLGSEYSYWKKFPSNPDLN